MLCCAVAFTQGLPLPALVVDLQAINGDGAPMLTLHHQSTVQAQRTNINFGVVDAKHGITVQMDLLRRRKPDLQTQDVGQRKPVSSVVASEELDSIISNVGIIAKAIIKSNTSGTQVAHITSCLMQVQSFHHSSKLCFCALCLCLDLAHLTCTSGLRYSLTMNVSFE